MGINKKILDGKKIDKAILEIKELQRKYAHADTIIVYHGLDKALNEIGWAYATLLENKK